MTESEFHKDAVSAMIKMLGAKGYATEKETYNDRGNRVDAVGTIGDRRMEVEVVKSHYADAYIVDMRQSRIRSPINRLVRLINDIILYCQRNNISLEDGRYIRSWDLRKVVCAVRSPSTADKFLITYQYIRESNYRVELLF